jgi:hypothetical protein
MTYIEAQDEMFGIVKLKLASLSYVAWPRVPAPTSPDKTSMWARVSTQIVRDSQSTIGNTGGTRKFEAIGLLYVQLFAPRNIAGSSEAALALAQIIQKEFRKASPSGLISFSNQKIVELPETDQNYPINVSVTFTYQDKQ